MLLNSDYPVWSRGLHFCNVAERKANFGQAISLFLKGRFSRLNSKWGEKAINEIPLVLIAWHLDSPYLNYMFCLVTGYSNHFSFFEYWLNTKQTKYTAVIYEPALGVILEY